MTKAFLLIALLFPLVFSALAQKSFIGQTKAQVRNYWKTEISEEYFDEGVWDDTGEEYFTIASRNIGTPEFSATFKDGKCIEQSAIITRSDLSVYRACLEKLGFVHSAKANTWSKPGVKYIWMIKEYAGGNYSLEAKKI